MRNGLLDAVIAGAGPGGLTAAVALTRSGKRCLVVERVARDRLCADVGGGYHVGSTTLAMLDALGAGDGCRRAGLRFRTFRTFTHRGQPLMRMPIPATFDMVTLRRSALQRVLLERVDEDLLRCGDGVESFTQDGDGVRVKLNSGEVLHSRLLIGADGVWSRVRQSLFGDGPPRFAGVTCCWGRVPRRQVAAASDWPAEDAFSHLGPGASTAVAEIGGEMLWSAFWRTPSFDKSPDAETRKRRLLTRFSDWRRPIPDLIESTPAEVIAEVGIWDRDPAPSWCQGRVALIGDAAHPMTPFLGQGANSAMLDAFVLVHHLARQPLTEAFETYQARRKPQTDRNILTARRICDASTAERAWQRWLMRTAMRLSAPRWILSFMTRADRKNDVSDLLAQPKK